MPRPELGELTAGQDVIVVRSPNDQLGRKPEEWYISARIVKASRVWIEIERADLQPSQLGHRTWRMRRDTQAEGSSFSGGNARFRTLQQHAWREAQWQARQVLAAQGIGVGIASPWSGREAELVDAIERGREYTGHMVNLPLLVDPYHLVHLGRDDHGSDVWLLPNGRWTFSEGGEGRQEAARRPRSFTPERYIEKYGRPTRS